MCSRNERASPQQSNAIATGDGRIVERGNAKANANVDADADANANSNAENAANADENERKGKRKGSVSEREPNRMRTKIE